MLQELLTHSSLCFEFVELTLNTLESKKHGGLYFAGEVLDVDAVTGGFNLQAAWTMGYVTAKSIADKYR